MNDVQIEGICQKLLAAGGPLASFLLAKGIDANTTNLVIEIALAVIPPIVAAVWNLIRTRAAALVISTSKIQGVQVQVDSTASDAVKNVAKSDSVPDVVFKKAA